MGSRFLIAAILICLLSPTDMLAQRTIGAVWSASNQNEPNRQQLRQLADIGISYLLVDDVPDKAGWTAMAELEFKVYAMLPIQFPTAQTFSTGDTAFTQRLNAQLTDFSNRDAVQAIGLFWYGQLQHQQFREEITGFIDQIRPRLAKPLFYATARPELSALDSLFTFKMLSFGEAPATSHADKVGAYFYRPPDGNRWSLAPVKHFLEETSKNDSLPVFFEAGWLQQMQQKHAGFQQTLRMYATSSDPVFALPRQDPVPPSRHNAIVIALLLAWIIFALSYYISPVYRKSLIRYFSGHRFYVDDVMHRHIRTPLPGMSILAQQVIAGGIFFYCLFNTAFTPLGVEALNHNANFLFLFGAPGLSLLGWGFLLTLMLLLICMFWLRIANPKLTHFSQILNLYPWPMQLNLFFVSALLALYLAGQSALLIYGTALLIILILLSAFIATALTTAGYVTSKKGWYIAATAGLYGFILSGLVVWAAASPAFMHVIALAASLPT